MSSKQYGEREVSAANVDDRGATMLHIDMDAFFASVELLDAPELANGPVAVGGTSGRGVVASANYIARRYGVRSAMPMGRALQLCPSLRVIEPHFEKYKHFSSIVMSIFRDVTPLVEPLSIDEAFLDVSGAQRLFGSPAVIGQLLRDRVREETNLPCSVGAAGVKFVAKLASGRAKPDGLLVVPVDRTLDFLHPLPVGAMWGVGKQTEDALVRRGIRTVRDLAEVPLDRLEKMLGTASGRRLHDLAWGRDPRGVETSRETKSISHENTFETDVDDPAELSRVLLDQATRVAERLRRAGLETRGVTIRVRFHDFTTLTRSTTLRAPTDTSRVIVDAARTLLAGVDLAGRRIRLLGVRADSLRPAGASDEMTLWSDESETENAAWGDAERTMDAVRSRFGRGIVQPAALLKRADVVDEKSQGVAPTNLP